MVGRKTVIVAFALFVAVFVVSFWGSGDSGCNLIADANEAEETRLDNGRLVKLGVSVNEPSAFQGYTLIFPLSRPVTYLMNMEGRVVHQWKHDTAPALCARLLENGNLLRCGRPKDKALLVPDPGGTGGLVQEYSWEGELLWEYKVPEKNLIPHHDVLKLPNGNVLVIAWDSRDLAEVAAAGRSPQYMADATRFLGDCILEIKPKGKNDGEIVWRWYAWDHIYQDLLPNKPHYIKPEEVPNHPELIDFNYVSRFLSMGTPQELNKELERLKSIGYMSSTPNPGTPGTTFKSDWTHINCVDYNPRFDQLMLCAKEFGEAWIIDHSTTTAEAAGHTGGRSGKGGDLLYRWGNPRTYRCGGAEDQMLFAQHNAHWIPEGVPGAGHLLVFNNGAGRPGGQYSSVDEVELPVDQNGVYSRTPKAAFGPKKPIWSYSAVRKDDLFSRHISGAQRLPNGNTLICSGMNGVVIEVTPDKEIVWQFVNPLGSDSASAPSMTTHSPPTFPPSVTPPPPPFPSVPIGTVPEINPAFPSAPIGTVPGINPAFPSGPIGTVPNNREILPPPEMPGTPPPPAPNMNLNTNLTPPTGVLRNSLFRAYRYGPDYPGLRGRSREPGLSLREIRKQRPDDLPPAAGLPKE